MASVEFGRHLFRHCYVIARFLLQLIGVLPSIIAASSPESEESHLRYTIDEELPRGTQVGTLIEDAGLNRKYPSDVLQLIRFRFLADSVELFDVGSATGIIRTTDQIDRDSPGLCRQKQSCEISLDVVVQPSQYFQIIKIKVEIADVNDNSPKFREGQIYLSIIEAAQVGSVYILPTAVDIDSPSLGIQRYELESPSNRFSLDSSAKIDGVQEVRLVLNEKLDRETESQYRLRLTAFDGGPTPRVGSSTVIVNVLDSNDNRPQFTSHQYEVSILENLPVGSVILQVQAVDRDAGLNGQVEYGFTPQTQTLLGGKFGVRNSSGEIVIRGNIDHEQASVYQLVVFARDHGPESFSSETTVVVHVEDLNDNAPEVTISTLTPSSSSYSAVMAEVWENSTVGTFVAHVSVVDHDAGPNGRVNCTLNENSFALVRKYATEYQIVTNAPLDRERTEQYAVTLKCQDGATVSRVTEKTLRVIVCDVNDNSPVFSQATYKGALIENNYIGASIMQVTASDWDDGDNARLQYSIPGHVASLFHVDQRGVISAHSAIDREKYDGFRFPILAADMGSPTRTGSALVIITIEDVNDEKPRFTQPSYIFSVLENEPPGTIVGTVSAEDKDGPQFNAFAFAFLTETSIGPGTFVINPSTGTITTQKPLDRELKGLYKFVVVAYDLKVITMSGSASVSVNVLDRNDNSPEFLFPRKTNDTVYISNQLPVGHIVTEVTVRDADLDNNAKVSFKILDDRNDPGAFRIDPTRGSILINSRLTGIDYRTFRLTISATDDGSPPRSQTAELKIHVNRTIAFGSTAAQTKKAFMSTFSLVLVTVLVAGLLVVIVVMCVAVVLVRQRERRRRVRKQNNRMEALRMLTTTEMDGGGGGGPGQGPLLTDSSPNKRTVLCNGGGKRTQPDATRGQDTSVPGSLLGVTDSPTSNDSQMTMMRAKVWNTQNVIREDALRTTAINGRKESSDFDKTSDPSITDSGRGPSEEGEGSAAGQPRSTRDRFLPPPPPPPRGSYWIQQQQQQQLRAQGYPTHHNYHSTLRFSELSTTPEEEAEGGSTSSPRALLAQTRSSVPRRAWTDGQTSQERVANPILLRRDSPDEGLPPEVAAGSFEDDSPETPEVGLPGYEEEEEEDEETDLEERLVGITETSTMDGRPSENGGGGGSGRGGEGGRGVGGGLCDLDIATTTTKEMTTTTMTKYGKTKEVMV